MKEKINSRSSISDVLYYYKNSSSFKKLSSNTYSHYTYGFSSICSTKVFGREIGSIKIRYLDALKCSEAYDTWVQSVSISYANRLSRLLSVLLNFAVSLDLIPNNPMAKVKKHTATTRSVIWTKEQVETFLDTAFSKFEWRSIGILVLLAYEYGQRPVDIRNLKWSDINFDSRRITITQTKRGATVYLPMEDNVYDVLIQQKRDWDWQQYVIPCQRPSDRAYVPFSCSQVGEVVNKVKAVCGLPSELQAGDLRKTAVVEMVSSGVDNLAIMSVTGHKNVQSLNPYNKNTLEAAKSALDMRRK